MANVDPQYPWWVRVYYADDVEPPKIPGKLAIETRHADEASRDIEIQVAKSRKDVGHVEWGRVR